MSKRDYGFALFIAGCLVEALAMSAVTVGSGLILLAGGMYLMMITERGRT